LPRQSRARDQPITLDQRITLATNLGEAGMARRRRKNTGNAARLVMLLLVFAVPAVAIFAVLSSVVHTRLLLVLLVAGGAGLLIWRWGQRHPGQRAHPRPGGPAVAGGAGDERARQHDHGHAEPH
jgi:Flp pilus assembly protein TadB